MKTVTEIKFEKVIKEGFQEILKPLGFKKKANNFYLKRTDLGQIINIQKSSLYSNDRINFTINLGLFIPEYWTGLTYNKGKEPPIFPTEQECLIRKRIGELKKQNDIWFEIDENLDENKLIAEIQFNLTKYILPYFDSAKTKEDLLNLLVNEELILAPLGKLIVYSELKQFENAKSEYRLILNKTTNPYFLETVKEYGQKYELE